MYALAPWIDPCPPSRSPTRTQPKMRRPRPRAKLSSAHRCDASNSPAVPLNPKPKHRADALPQRIGSGASAIEVLEQVVGGQFNIFVIELCGSVDAGDESRAVDAA